MTTPVVSAGRAASAAVAAVLVTGCAGGVERSAPAGTASPAPFGQKAVMVDLDAALADAGLPGERPTAGFRGPERSSAPATAKERTLARLAPRLAPCAVTWTSDGTGRPSGTDPSEARRRLHAVLAGLAARGWKETEPSQEMPLGRDGSYFMASYRKQGWVLNARHGSLGTWDRTTAMATEEACFGQLTDEEAALVQD